MKFGKPKPEPTALTFTPMAYGVRRAVAPNGSYWSIKGKTRHRAYWCAIGTQDMRPLGTWETLQDAEDACRHHAAGVGEVAA